MPIRNIDVYVRELKLTQESRISVLADTRLGIEGHNWLRQLMFRTHDGEAVAMGGLPVALEAEIIKELQFFRQNSITPIFVFSGLPVARKDSRPFAKDDHRPSHRSAAWDMYWQKQTEQALRKWGTSSPHAQADIIPFVMQVLQANDAEYMRAPYSSWGQLAYLYKHESQPIHAIYSSLDVLMFDVDRVITSISSTKMTFSWIQREHIVSRCGVTSDQILDMCILAGFDWCPTFPALLSDIGFSFKSAVDITRQYRSGFNAIQMLGDHAGIRSSNYSDSYIRAYCTVKYHIVMHLDGSIGPLNPEYAPNDLHDIIGYRLPTEAYHLLARGIVHPPVLNMLVSGSWLEFSPADNGESEEYHRLITQWESGIYKQLCTSLCGSMGSFFKQRKISMCAWFDPQTEIVLHDISSAKRHNLSGPPALKPGAEQKKTDPASTSLMYALERSKELLMPQRKGGNGTAHVGLASGAGDTQLTAQQQQLMMLMSLGFITRSGEHTPLGAALRRGLQELACRTSPQKDQPADSSVSPPPRKEVELLQWAVAVAAILLEQGLLSSKKWTVAYEDEHSPVGDERQQTHVRIVSRIATLVPMGGRRGQWKLAYNRDALALCSAAKLVLKTAASCFDSACLVRSAAGDEASRERRLSPEQTSSLLELKRSMPLECAASNASGLLTHALLADYARNGSGCWERIQAAARESIDDPKQALRNIWDLVEAVLAMAQEYSRRSDGGRTKHAKETASELKNARDWATHAFDAALA